jgi:RND superfamily putative drug exporter
LAIAVAVDASVVRILLVPAVMRVLGRSAWWAPGPLARLHRRLAIGEAAEAEPQAGLESPRQRPQQAGQDDDGPALLEETLMPAWWP